LDKLTTKSQEALQQAQSLAEKRNHQAIDVEHLLFALLGQKEGVVLSLLQKLGASTSSLTERLQEAPDRPPEGNGATRRSRSRNPQGRLRFSRAFASRDAPGQRRSR